MVTDHCRYRNHVTHQVYFHSQQNESPRIISPCQPRSLQYRRGYCPFLAFFHSTRLQIRVSVAQRFGGRDSRFARGAFLNFAPIEQAQ